MESSSKSEGESSDRLTSSLRHAQLAIWHDGRTLNSSSSLLGGSKRLQEHYPSQPLRSANQSKLCNWAPGGCASWYRSSTFEDISVVGAEGSLGSGGRMVQLPNRLYVEGCLCHCHGLIAAILE